MSHQTTCAASHSAISSPGSASGLMLCVWPDGRITNRSGQEVARASLSARLVKALGLMTSGTYGQRYSTSSASDALSWYLANRLQESMPGSILYKLTWKQWTTPLGLSRFRLRASVPRISETEHIGWPTPAASDHSGGGSASIALRKMSGDRRPSGNPLHSSLRDFAHLAGWYTPTCNTNPQPETKRGLETLAGLSRLAGWPSPLASNTKTAYQDAEKVIARQQAGRQPNLQDYACLSGWPTSDDDRQQPGSGRGRSGQSSRTGNDPRRRSENLRPNTINGCWDDADWLLCRDGRWRPVESGTFPLAHGITSRVGRLRAYGNAIVAPAAATFIRSFMECAGYDLI
ncbi:Uncharacterised protein [Enterobacter asburiae]|uniref:DNA (cytosine-5-)-methyltransferase n=1 Tax=Enterobacter asburiae TaxID=61645 RepID=A0A376EV91_ENTAS|nr:Uncharacterised protein [Enterobacter asburiae]